MDKVIIPAPKAKFGEIILVLNYRNNTWEYGKVAHLRYENMWGKWSWSYDIETVRLAKSGYPVKLYVGDEGIRR